MCAAATYSYVHLQFQSVYITNFLFLPSPLRSVVMFPEVIVLLAVQATVVQSQDFKPSLDHERTQFYDPLGFETDLTYEGGYVMIFCVLKLEFPNVSVPMELIGPPPQNKVMGSKECHRGWYGTAAELRLNISETTPFGEYRCRFQKRLSDDNLDIQYRLCSDRNEKYFEKPCLDKESFCIIRGHPPKANLCTRFTEPRKFCPFGMWSRMRHKRFRRGEFCPSGGISLCWALENYEKAYSLIWKSVCPTNEREIPWVGTHGHKKYAYNEPIPMNKEMEYPGRIYVDFMFSDARFEVINMICPIKDMKGDTVDSKTYIRGGGRLLEFGNKIFERGSQIYKFECVILDNKTNYELAHVTNLLVVQDGNAVINRIKDTNKLICKLTPPYADQFIVEYSWSVDGSDDHVLSKTPEFVFTQPGNYVCKANPVYRSLNPYRIISMNNPPSVQHVVTEESILTTNTGNRAAATEKLLEFGGIMIYYHIFISGFEK